MKKIKLKLSESQVKALILIINTAGIGIIINDIDDMALKEQYTKLFIKLQVRVLNLKPKNNSLKLSLTECWAIMQLQYFEGYAGFEMSTLKAICREIDQQVVSM